MGSYLVKALVKQHDDDGLPFRREGVSSALPSGAGVRGAATPRTAARVPQSESASAAAQIQSQDVARGSDEDSSIDQVMPQVTFEEPLHDNPVVEKRRQNRKALGGMRCPRKAVGRLPQLNRSGKKVVAIVKQFIMDNPPVIKECLDALKVPDHPGPTDELLGEQRARLMSEFMYDGSLGPAAPGVVTGLDAELIEAWLLYAGDPDYE